MDCNADIQNMPAASYNYEQEEDDDADDDDIFENHCDIEDRQLLNDHDPARV
jgi:hypothetical protein